MNTFQKLLLVPLLVIVSALAGNAQTAVTSTTLSSAVTTTAGQTVIVASATGISAPGQNGTTQTALYVGRELMLVTAVNSTTISVTRGYGGTFATTHSSGATVYIGAPQYFVAQPGTQYPLSGSCTRTNIPSLPTIIVGKMTPNVGGIYDCFGSAWYVNDNMARYTLNMAPGAQPSSATPNAGAANTLTGQAGGVSTAAGTAGGAGAAWTITSGAGGAGASTGTAGAGGAMTLASGAGGAAAGAAATGGAGGAVAISSGAGGGTITGGAGGAITITAGAGANGSTAGGSGGNVTLKAGAVGTGGTGSAGVIRFADSADGTKLISFLLSGITTATTRIVTWPDAAITVSGIQAQICGTTTTCSATNTPTLKIATGNVALSSGTPSTAALTAISPAFTGTTTYQCAASLEGTTAAQAAFGVAVNKVSSSAVTFTSANTQTLVVDYVCMGT